MGRFGTLKRKSPRPWGEEIRVYWLYIVCNPFWVRDFKAFYGYPIVVEYDVVDVLGLLIRAFALM